MEQLPERHGCMSEQFWFKTEVQTRARVRSATEPVQYDSGGIDAVRAHHDNIVTVRGWGDASQLALVGVVADTDDVDLDAAPAYRRRLRQRPVRLHGRPAVGDDDRDVGDSRAVAVNDREDQCMYKLEGSLGIGLTATFTERKRQCVLYLKQVRQQQRS